MTVNSTVSSASYAGTGTTATYPYVWGISSNADLFVYTYVTNTASLTLLTQPSGYTVSGAGNQTGGTITLTAGSLPVGTSIYIASSPAQVQSLLLQQGAAFNPNDLMNAFDYLCREVQAVDRKYSGSLRIPEPLAALGAPLNTVLPIPVANQVIGWNGLATSLVNLSLGSVPLVTPGTGSVTASTIAPGSVGQVTLASDVQYRVDTIAALKALTVTYKSVLVLGYYAAGDGGGGKFYWDAASTATDNAGTIFALNAGGTGRFIRIFNGVFNVRYFGAKGDNVASDTPYLNLAVAACVLAGKGSIYIPNGVYRMDTQFLVNGSNIRVYGDGIGITVLRCNAWIDGIRVADGYPAANTDLTNITIENISVNGDRSGHSNGANDTNGNGININACNRVIVRNCEVYDMEQQGIASTYWQVAGQKQDSIVIDSCIVRNTQSNRIAIGIEGRGRAAHITNNAIVNGGSLYVGHQSGTGVDNGETQVIGNRVDGTGNTTGYGIIITDNMYNCSVIGNFVTGYDIGIRISSNGQSLSDFIVSNNVVINFNSYGILAGPMNGSVSSNIMVTHNKLKSATGTAAIGLYKAASAIGNRIDGVLGVGILCSDNGNQIIGNTITSTGYSVSLGTTTGNQILCNYLSTQVDSSVSVLLNNQFGNYGSTVNRGSDYYLGTARFTATNAAPSTGTWAIGDTVVNSSPTAGANSGWVCITAGTPGTWLRYGFIALEGSATIDPANLAAGAEQTLATITVTGASLGDYVTISAPYDLQGCMITGYVSAADTVTIRQRNGTAGAIDLASGTWRARVVKQ